MREFLKGLELDSETIDAIMAEHGKLITKDKESILDLKNQISELKELNKNSKGSEELQKKYDELKSRLDKEDEKKSDEKLQDDINSLLNGKKFVNDYTKNSILVEVKKLMSDKSNSEKTLKELFDSITKDKEGIFENPNRPANIPSINQNTNKSVTKDEFNKMSYVDRINLKSENPTLFNQLNNEE